MGGAAPARGRPDRDRPCDGKIDLRLSRRQDCEMVDARPRRLRRSTRVRSDGQGSKNGTTKSLCKVLRNGKRLTGPATSEVTYRGISIGKIPPKLIRLSRSDRGAARCPALFPRPRSCSRACVPYSAWA